MNHKCNSTTISYLSSTVPRAEMAWSSLPPISFYLAPHRWVVDRVLDRITPAYIDEVTHFFFNGPWLSWTFQTFLRLNAAGFPCRLVKEMPEEGIVLAVRGDVDFAFKPRPNLLIACMNGGAGWLPYGQVQIVQNRHQAKKLPNAYFMPHWTQPGLIPRNDDRGLKFENVAFFGHMDQLASELKEPRWADFLWEQGLTWKAIDRHSPRKHDYSDIDLIVAIRSFDGRQYPEKPATKLYNAWHAGVPTILGAEYAYREERKSELDFIEVDSYEALCEGVIRLKSDDSLRRKMMDNGKQRAVDTQTDRMVKRWISLIEDQLAPAYESWTQKSSVQQKAFFAGRHLSIRKNGVLKRLGVETR